MQKKKNKKMKLTDRQVNLLLLYAQNYSLHSIAKEFKVAYKTIEVSLYRLSKRHPEEYARAFALRICYQDAKESLEKPISIYDIDENRCHVRYD